MQASGTLAKTLVYSRSRAQNLVRSYGTHTDPQTPAQLVQRARFGNATAALMESDPEVVNSWRANSRLVPGEIARNPFLAAQLNAQSATFYPAYAIRNIILEYAGGPLYLRLRFAYNPWQNPGGPPPPPYNVPITIVMTSDAPEAANWGGKPSWNQIGAVGGGIYQAEFDSCPLGLSSVRLWIYLAATIDFRRCVCWGKEVSIT
jgi:hypothetical protein